MLLAALAAAVIATSPPPDDANNIALSTAILNRVGDRLWPDWSKAPFAIDLLTADGPVEINFAKPIPVPSFPPQLEASFPLGGVPTIVIGEPRFTAARTPTRWSVTLLHEHFHQWQDHWPPYFEATRALGLAGNDKTAMWMLNYPFPYADWNTDKAYRTASLRLADALDALGTPTFAQSLEAYLDARAAFKAFLRADDYKYFAFQCWQEGVARYTEIKVARLAVAAHRHDAAFLTNEQATALASDAGQTLAGIMRSLRNPSLALDKRTAFYAYGAAEALLLDQAAPGWRTKYLDPSMDLGKYFPSSQ
jgi:hypothetical protein